MRNDYNGKKRSELPDSVFGIPQERKYPMPDEKHTRSAIKLFNHVESKYEEQLAKAIIKNMKKYNIDGSVVGPNNRLRTYLPKDMIKENYMLEGYFKSDKDIYHNKDKFDSGEINLCFITGLSGSGKSTMGRGMSSKDVEHYEMDNVICNDNFSDNNLKEYGGLIESFFKGSGKSFRLISGDDNHNDSVFKSHKNYEKEITQAFVKHAISYCKSHKETKYVCDGIWIFMFIKPEQLKDCAVYIKGTSSIKSGYRALKRDIDEDKRNGMTSLQIFKREFTRVKEDVLYAKENQKELKSFRSYFEKQLTNESYIEESSIPEEIPKDMIKESFMLEYTESTASTVANDHKQNGYIKLSSLKKVRITEYLINKYKQEYPVLRHVRCKDTDEYVCDGYMWFKDNNLVCYVGSCQYTDDNTKWIVSLEIVPEYRGYGLSNQILDFCVKSMNCKYLSVAKSNQLAKKIYDKYGFKVYHEDKTMYYMTLDNISKNSTKESFISEGYLKSDKDIYYNKDKFDSGEINLCFITGLSGSGKSTMGRDMSSKNNVEHYELDDLNQNYKFTDEDLKKYGDLIYSFFKGPGKKYRYYSFKDMQNCTNPLDDSGDEFDKFVNRDFVKYAMKYAKSHKNTKFVIEGIWLYFFFKPEELKDYAVYIKGTSRLISAFRAARRDSRDADTEIKRFLYSIKGTLGTLTNKYSIEGEKSIKKYRDYYGKLEKVDESTISEGLFNKTKSIVDIRKDSTKKAKVYLKKNFSRYPALKKGYFVLDELETDLDEWNDIEYRKKQMYDYYMGYSDRIAIYHNLLTKNYPDAINNKWIYSNVVEPLIKICDEFENTLPGFKLHCSSNKNMTSVLVYVVAKSSTKESSEDIELDKDFLNELNFLTRPSITTDDQKDRTTAYFQANSHVLRFLNTHPDLRKGQIVHSSPNVRLDEYMDPTNKAMIFKNFIEGNRKSIAIYHNMLYSNYGKKGFEWVKENVIKPVNEMCDTFKYNGYELYGSVNEQYTSLLVSLRQKSVKESAISEGLFGKKATDEEMKKAADEIIDFIKPIVMTPTNKTRAKNIGLKLQCSIENIDKNIVCILILDGPQDRRDTDDAKSILEDIRYRVKSSLSPLVSKIDMGDGDEGCLYFTVNTKRVRKISESVIHENEISETEIDDIKTVISSLDDDSFNDFKFSDIVYCDIRYRSKKPIAFITIRTKLINNYTVGYVSLAVNPKYQNQGIGKSLTQKAVQWFKQERGIAFLEWHCLPDNEASRKLANSAGFKEYIAKDHNDYVHYTMESVIQDTNIISKNKRTFSPDAVGNAIGEYGTTAGTMVGSNQPDSVYIVNYMQNNAFSGHKEPRFGICKKGMKDLHIVGGKYNKFHYVSDLNKFRDESSDIHVYRYKGKPKTSFYDIVREMDDDDLNIYKFITGRDIDDRSSIEFDGDFIEEECFLDELDAIKACTEAGLLSVAENTYPVPILTETVQGRPYNYYRDLNGVFIQNEITHIRSKSYDSIDEIPYSEITLVKRGYLV